MRTHFFRSRKARSGRIVAICLLSIGYAAPESSLAQSWRVPLLVQEALADDPHQTGFQLQPGVARDDEPFTVGIPLPDAMAIVESSDLGLSGSAVGQFRVLDRWPSGNVRWVLVDGQADLAASTQSQTVALVPGNGGFGGPPLASDLGGTIRIETGTAQFTIRKSAFNLLDRVVVGGTELVSAGSSTGIELIGTDGTVYRASNDPGVSVVIEENGPARAVVLARGTHRAANGARNLEFTIRMHFYRGKSRVRTFYTLRNASLAQVANEPFRSLELMLRTTLSAPAYRVSTHGADAIGSLAAGQSLRLFVGENAFPNFRDFDFSNFDDEGNEISTKWPTTIQGYTWRRTNPVQTIASGSREQFFDLAWARASTAAGAVTFGTRFASGWWPQGLGLDADGTVRIGIFPAANDRDYRSRFAGHVTRELLLDFAAGTPPSARDQFYRFQYPLVAKAVDAGWYEKSGALWDAPLSVQQEASAYAARGWPIQELLGRRPELRMYRHYYWGTGGGDNQFDFTKIDLHNFLRRDGLYAGGYWLAAEQRIAYNADLAVYHSDDFDGSSAAAPDFDEMPGIEAVPIAKAIFEGEHRHAYGIPLLYWLSGDERLREAYVDWGDWMHHFQAEGFNDYERGIAWNLYNLIDLYRFSGNVADRDLAWQFFEDEMWPTAVVNTAPGTDRQRGFFVSRWVTNNPVPSAGRVVNSFIYGAMIPRSLAYLHDFGDLSNLDRDRVRDLLDGANRFLSHEHWYEYPNGQGALTVSNFGLPYAQSLDVPRNPPDARLEPNWWEGFKEGWNAFYFGYLTSGDPEFLRRGRLLQWAAAVNPNAWNFYHDWPDRQRLERLLASPDAFAVWRDLPISAESLGSGSYRLTWTVPERASDYWIKRSDRSIVPWLNFDRVNRTFQFPPASFTPFFAAENLVGEPAPASPGSVQSWIVTGQPAGATFAARYLQSARGGFLFCDGFDGGNVAAWVPAIP